MWLIQTPIEGLVLPTDDDGNTTLVGHVPSWHHIVRTRTRHRDRERDAGRDADAADAADARLVSSELRWDIRPWYESAGKIYFHGATGGQDMLLDGVRASRHRPLARATFPAPGRRRSDTIVQLTIVVPPESFARYESMVRLAMMLPAGMVLLSLATPLVDPDASRMGRLTPHGRGSDVGERHRESGSESGSASRSENGSEQERDDRRTNGSDASTASMGPSVNGDGEMARLLSPGQTTLITGLELVVSRAMASPFTPAQLGGEQRETMQPPVVSAHLDDDGYADWYHFRRVDQ